MTTIEKIMALADAYKDSYGREEIKDTREALITALTEAIAQPVREFDGSDEFYEYWSRVPNFTQSQAWEAYTSNQPVLEPLKAHSLPDFSTIFGGDK